MCALCDVVRKVQSHQAEANVFIRIFGGIFCEGKRNDLHGKIKSKRSSIINHEESIKCM